MLMYATFLSIVIDDFSFLGQKKWRKLVPLKYRCMSVTPDLRIQQSEIVILFDDA
jgi:hypothetical protein